MFAREGCCRHGFFGGAVVRAVVLLAVGSCLPTAAYAKNGVSLSLYPVTGAPGQTVTLKTAVYSGGAPVSGLTIQFAVEGILVGSGVSGASYAATSYTILPSMAAGTHDVTVTFAGNDSYYPASLTAKALTVSVTKANVSLSLYASTGYAGQNVALKSLVYSGGAPVSGLTIQFSVDGTPVGSAVSGASNASFVYAIPAAMSAGTHSVTASFAGNSQYNSAIRTGPFLTVVIAKGGVSFSLCSVTGPPGGIVSLCTLVYSGGSPAIGLPVQFSVDGNAVASVMSNSSGASLSYLIPPSMPTGYHSVTVSFAGDATHSAASRTALALNVKGSPVAKDYILYGDLNNTTQWSVDDNLDLYVNGTLVYTTGSGYSGRHLPVGFVANPGDTLRIVVRDTYGSCCSMSALYLRDNFGNAQLIDPGFSQGCGLGGGNRGIQHDVTVTIPF